jgi:hypothetical protein
MHVDPQAPDMATTIALDRYAPREARFQVREVGSPSPDLRDAVVLLTSEIVSRAVEHCIGADEGTDAELRVWMPRHVVRVELRAPPASLPADAAELAPRHFDLMLLDAVADRWSIDQAGDGACFWFEIDRVETPKPPHGGEPGALAEDTAAHRAAHAGR